MQHKWRCVTCITSNGAGEVCVDGGSETVVPEGISTHTARVEVFRRQHTSRCHDADECVERGL